MDEQQWTALVAELGEQFPTFPVETVDAEAREAIVQVEDAGTDSTPDEVQKVASQRLDDLQTRQSAEGERRATGLA